MNELRRALPRRQTWSMHSMTTNATRITRTYRQTIKASPDDVFPLLCPVREADWLDGWQYTMRHSASGLVEEGAVFSTPGQGEPETVWIVTRHDPKRRLVEFARFTPDSRVCVLRIQVTPNPPGRSFVHVSYTYTALTPAGEAFIARFTEASFLEAMRFWERSMNHWLETGERLPKQP
jgi:hypothetical protein